MTNERDPKRETCSVEACPNAVRSYRWCAKHLAYIKTHKPEEFEIRRREVLGIPDRDHGRRSRYVKGCRCDECRDAERQYRAEYRRRQR